MRKVAMSNTSQRILHHELYRSTQRLQARHIIRILQNYWKPLDNKQHCNEYPCCCSHTSNPSIATPCNHPNNHYKTHRDKYCKSSITTTEDDESTRGSKRHKYSSNRHGHKRKAHECHYCSSVAE